MGNFKKRLPTAIAFGLVILGSLYFNMYTYFMVFAVFLGIAVWEFFALFENSSKKLVKVFSLILALSLYCYSFFDAAFGLNPKFYFLFVPPAFLLFFMNIYSLKQGKTFAPFINLGALFYIALPFSFLNHFVFQNHQYNPSQGIGLILLIWANDTFAYLSGSKFGKKKLFPRVSPGKSWEGFVGGLAAAMAFGFTYGYFYDSQAKWVIYGVLMAVFGTMGDLIESHIKRLAHVKDSGKILPGHGGVLDRFDALIYALPFIFFIDLFFFS